MLASGAASVTGTTINVKTTGIASGANSDEGAIGVFSQNAGAIISSSTINALTTGNVENGAFVQALGIRTGQGVSLTKSTVLAQSSGNAKSGGQATVFGINSTLDAHVVDSTVTGKTMGNVEGATSFAQATGVISGTSSIISNSTVKALSSGLSTNSGLVNVFGVQGTTAVIFEGNASSFVTAMAAHGTGLPTTGPVTNNSTPKSQCSTNGVMFTNC